MTTRDMQHAMRIAKHEAEPLSWWVWVVALIIVGLAGVIVK